MTTSPNRWRFDRQISIALLVTVALQAAAALMWAGRASARIDDLRQRLDAQAPVAERLARLETQADATRASLARIETKLDGDRRD
jgi:type VI protein secretion system component VasK